MIFERVSRNTRRPLLQTPNPRETVAQLLAARQPQYAESGAVHARYHHALARRSRRGGDRRSAPGVFVAECGVKSELVAYAEDLGFDLCRVAPGQRAAACRGVPRLAGRRPRRRHGLAGAQRRSAHRSAAGAAGRAQRGGAGDELLAGGACGDRRSEIGVREHAQADLPISELRSPIHGRIARYAWGDDYHDVIEKKLRALDEWLTARGGRQRCYVDTGPVLERDFAALAGAGWHGKSTMLIHPKLGTWFFLAEVLTTLELEPDAPMRDHCGRCTRCIDACPTGAITAPHQLDARRCISYLTIEHKGAIPLEFRPLIGDRIYGCDDCLAACPWNRFAQAGRETAFAAREFVHGWTLRDFLDARRRRFPRALPQIADQADQAPRLPAQRLRGAGQCGHADDLPALRRAAQDAEPLIAEHAAWAMSRSGANRNARRERVH